MFLLLQTTAKLWDKEWLDSEQPSNSEPFPMTNLPVYLVNCEQPGISEQFDNEHIWLYFEICYGLSGILRIFWYFFFRSSDEGKYTCVRTNEAGSVNAEAWISVLVRTQIIQPPVDTKVILGKYSY